MCVACLCPWGCGPPWSKINRSPGLRRCLCLGSGLESNRQNGWRSDRREAVRREADICETACSNRHRCCSLQPNLRWRCSGLLGRSRGSCGGNPLACPSSSNLPYSSTSDSSLDSCATDLATEVGTDLGMADLVVETGAAAGASDLATEMGSAAVMATSVGARSATAAASSARRAAVASASTVSQIAQAAGQSALIKP